MSAVAAPRPGPAYRARTVDDIDAVDPAEWDALLAPEDVQASHRFVRLCRDARVEDARYRHVLLHDARGLAAFATLSALRVPLDLMSTRLARSAVALVRGVRPTFLRMPVALCGLPVSFGDSCLRARPDVDRAAVAETVATELARFGAETGASLLCLKELDPAEAARWEAFGAHGFLPAPSLPTFVLPLPWRTFDAYLASMRAGYRRQAIASLRAARACGLTTRVVQDFGGECPRLFALYEQVMDRAPVQMERLGLAFFQELDRALGAASRALLVEQDGHLVASAVLVRAGTLDTFLLAGIDYARNRACHAYLNLVLAVVADAIGRGAAHLRLGQTSPDLKTRLGGVAESRTVRLRHARPVAHRLLAAARGALFPERPAPVRRVFRT